MPNRKPHSRQRHGVANVRLAGAAVIGFSLTLVAAGIAMLVGIVPQRMLPAFDGIDATIVLLFVPLCALTLAILAEAVRVSFSGGFQRAARHANPLEPWRPGRGEG